MRSEAWRALLVLALAGPAARATPPLALPAWAEVVAEPAGGLELGREAALWIRCEARVGSLKVQPPTLAGEGFRLVSGPSPAGSQTSSPGRPVRFRFRVALEAAGPVRIGARLTASVPRAAMAAQLPAMYPDAPAERLAELRTRIDALGGHQVLEAFVRPWLTREEGAAPGDGPRFELYLPAGRAVFPLWNPPAPAGSGAAAAALGTASPRLARLLREAGTVPPAPGAGAYAGLLASLRDAGPEQAGDLAGSFASLADRDGIEGYAAAMAEVAALARAGRIDEAAKRAGALTGRAGPSHYAWFAAAELAAARGDLEAARAGYGKALGVRPALSIARRRLAELEGR